MKLLYYYLILVNLAAFILMGIDKYRACRHRWRIPERTLFLPVLLGGGAGGCAGMWLFRHKTRHQQFSIGFPLILILQAALIFLLVSWLN